MLKVDRGNYSSYNPYYDHRYYRLRYDSPQSIGEVTCNHVLLVVWSPVVLHRFLVNLYDAKLRTLQGIFI